MASNIIVSKAPAATYSSDSGDLGLKTEPGTGVGPSTNATYMVNNTAGNTTYIYQCFYGSSPAGSGNRKSGTTGTSSWGAGTDNLPDYFYVQFMNATRGSNPTSWTNYDGQDTPTENKDGSWTAKLTSSTYSDAGITIQITGGGGGPE
ncbi:MAG: hypothetical protein Q8916_09295 [Bacteroidota bacterium]|nr:hypothetical protein [Bacteroidota bacterium]MDP4230582.1 hypothetical protein [Bacteroidota bacterium]MDP4237650.1 hypothetical protein [Bacteroidota bacterium]